MEQQYTMETTKETKSMKVINNQGEMEEFQPLKIKQKVLSETNISEEEADKIKRNVVNLIYNKQFKEEINTTTIRSLVNSQLVKRGLLKEEIMSRIIGMSVADYEDLMENGCRDNANMIYTPEIVAKYAFDAVAKGYELATMPLEFSQAHSEGYLHIHDLETFSLKPNCLNHDIRWYARNGLMIDGKGEMGSVANPAKSLKVLMNHMLQAFMAGSQCLSGGQAYSHFNIFLAPFCKGLSYEEVKQEVQGFIFNLNMSCISRGSQTIFSSINVEFEVPDFLKDVPAVSFGGVIDGVYGDYQQEADYLFQAVCEVLREKDAIQRYHTFPNTIFVIREHTLDEYDYDWRVKMVHELLSENPTIYFMNCVKENSIVMGCRTRLSDNYTGDWEKDLLNIGNFHYCTVNLPLIAIESKDLQEFYDKLKHYIDLSREILLYRKAKVQQTFERGMSGFLLQPDKVTGEPLYNIEYATFSVGMCGLNECLMALEGKELIDDPELGEEIIKFMSDTVLGYKEKDGLRWSLFFTPAESTAHRFATIIKKKYPDAFVQGEEGNYYLTNSSHLPVHNDEASLVEHFKNADRFHKYAGAGNIAHAWLGEAFPSPEALYSFNKKVAQTETKFWAFTNDYTYCRKCGYAIQLAYDKCPICDSTDVTVMSRITGYYQPVKMYNEGKKKEWQERYRHQLNR